MKILGLHNSLESSVSLYLNGKIISAVSEERFNRIKNYRGFPKRALEYTLKKYNLALKDFDFIVYGIIDKIYPENDIKSKFLKKKVKLQKNSIKNLMKGLKLKLIGIKDI